MRDYYYILGIQRTASIQEVKQAYRKLSIKFHPDKNDGDEFFAERFRDIQEAYETLSDSERRMRYNQELSFKGQSGTSDNNFEPAIDYFKTDKTEFEFEEEITFYWRTINANQVSISPFGRVEPIGQRKFRFKNFKKERLRFELVAENTTISRIAKKQISLENKTYQELYAHFKKIFDSENDHENERTKTTTSSPRTTTTTGISYSILSEKNRQDIAWGRFTSYEIRFSDGVIGEIFKGGSSNRYFYFDITFGKKYCVDWEDTINRLFVHLKNKGNF